MKKFVLIILFFSVIFGLSVQCHAENLALHFDERKWELGYDAKNDKEGLKEYVLRGETVNNWSELVTVQAFFGLQNRATPQQIMDNMMQGIKKACPDFKGNVISKSDKDVVFDWEVVNCPGQANQYEIDRVISGSEAIWVIHYVTKKLPVSNDDRNKWKKLLSNSRLKL